MTSALPLVVASLLRVRAAVVAAAVALVVFALLFAGRALPGPQPAAHGRELTVMTLNARIGSADARTVIEMVRSHRVDVLAMQEVTPQIAERLRAGDLAQVLPYSLVDSRPGPFGGGLWSRLPLTRTYLETRPLLSQAPEASIAGLGVRVRSVHASPPISAKRVYAWHTTLATLPGPATGDGTLRVLAGDYNATLDHKALRSVIDRGYTDAADATGQGLVTTWPSDRNFALTLDHVLVDKRIRVLRVQILHVPGSDHRAMIVRMRLP